MRNRSKWALCLISSMLVCTLLIGCNDVTKPEVTVSPIATEKQELVESNYNSAFEKYNDNITELGLVMNDPTEENLKDLTFETYRRGDTKECILIIPKYNGSKIAVSTVEYTGERFIAKENLYTKENTQEGYGLLLYANRPEGIPEIMITVTYKNKSIDYRLESDGKEGNVGIEYLKLEAENVAVDETKEVITPIQDHTYLDGLNRFNHYNVDIDQDGENETIEVFCQGSMTEDGTFLLDDGQLWALVLRKGNDIYPLFEKSFIQLGGIGYTAYVDYNNYEQIHILVKYQTGAGMMTFDCSFDHESGRIIRKTVFEANNISILKNWDYE